MSEDNWLGVGFRKRVTRMNDYILNYKAQILYGPCLVSTYASWWAYYDRSDIRRDSNTNLNLNSENDNFILLIAFSLTVCISNVIFCFAQSLVFTFLNGASLWRKADKNKKIAIYGMAVAVVYGIVGYLIPISIIVHKHLTMEKDEIDGYLPELYLLGRLTNLFYVTHYLYIRTDLMPDYFPGLFAVLLVYTYNFSSTLRTCKR